MTPRPRPGVRRRLVPGALLLVAAASLAASSAAAPAAPPAEPPAVEVARSGAFETSIAHLPGRLLASAVARDAAGRYGLAMLVADDGGHPKAPAKGGDSAGDPAAGLSRSMFFLEPGKSTLERLATALPEKIDALAALAEPGNLADQLILGEPGLLYVLDRPAGGASGSCRKLLEEPGLDLRSLAGESAGEPRPRLPWVPVARAGRLELLAGDAASPSLRSLQPLQSLRAVATFPLPLAASRESWGIKLTSLPIHLLPMPRPAPPGFVAGPEPQGEQRLRTLLFSATAGPAPVEAWSLQPAAVKEVENRYATWDGRAVLVVSSIPRFGIFVKRDLRLFLLARDRSRGGSPPILAVHTDCHLWHAIKTYFADLGGTGRQDLVFIHPEGLSGKKLHFEVHTNAGQDRLAAQARATTVDVEADDWFYGADLTGDGVPDLLVRSKGRLLLYPGLPRAYRVAEKPSWSFNLPVPPPPPRDGKHQAKVEDDGDESNDSGKIEVGDGQPSRAPAARLAHLVDLRNDGHAVLLLAITDEQGRSQIVAVRRAP